MRAKTLTEFARKPAQPNRRATADMRFDVANRLFFRLYQASNLMHRTGTRAVNGHGATTQQWAVMGALSRAMIVDAGMSVKALMSTLAVSRQSLTMVLNRMEGLGLVERVRLETDGRIRRVRLTASGRATWTKMLVDIRTFYATAIADFSTADAHLLLTLLDRLTAKLGRL
jgi:MarR family transcriptional regulator, organic hydroperoxide resistance regulator